MHQHLLMRTGRAEVVVSAITLCIQSVDDAFAGGQMQLLCRWPNGLERSTADCDNKPEAFARLLAQARTLED